MSMADEAYACAVVGCPNGWNHHSAQRVTFTVRLSRSVYRPVTIRAQIPLCGVHYLFDDQGAPE